MTGENRRGLVLGGLIAVAGFVLLAVGLRAAHAPSAHPPWRPAGSIVIYVLGGGAPSTALAFVGGITTVVGLVKMTFETLKVVRDFFERPKKGKGRKR